MLNRVILIGRLTRDPELTYSGSGTAICKFTIACDRPVAKGKEKEADFINIVSFKQTAEAVANYLRKGRLAAVEGRLQIRNYDKDGQKVWVSEIIADNVKFLESNKDGSQRADNPAETSQRNYEDIPEDDLPF